VPVIRPLLLLRWRALVNTLAALWHVSALASVHRPLKSHRFWSGRRACHAEGRGFEPRRSRQSFQRLRELPHLLVTVLGRRCDSYRWPLFGVGLIPASAVRRMLHAPSKHSTVDRVRGLAQPVRDRICHVARRIGRRRPARIALKCPERRRSPSCRVWAGPKHRCADFREIFFQLWHRGPAPSGDHPSAPARCQRCATACHPAARTRATRDRRKPC
jgi:hypothetical protein